jgi:hypothetical protein
VLFLFQDPGVPRMHTWKLGVINKQQSRSKYEIRYVTSPGTLPKFICRDLRHICVICGVDELPPMSRLYYENQVSTGLD